MIDISSLKGKGTAIITLVVFAFVLLFVGVMFKDRMNDLLIFYTERQTGRHLRECYGSVLYADVS